MPDYGACCADGDTVSHGATPCGRDADISLSCRLTRMAEHLLYGTEVGAPSSRCVANECRRVCGLIERVIPASDASFFYYIEYR